VNEKANINEIANPSIIISRNQVEVSSKKKINSNICFQRCDWIDGDG